MSREQRMSSGCALAATFGDDVATSTPKNFVSFQSSHTAIHGPILVHRTLDVQNEIWSAHYVPGMRGDDSSGSNFP